MDMTQRSTISWGAIVAGAVATAAVFLVFITFGGSLGLAVASTAPTWRDASFALWATTGVYLVLASVISFGLGGYIAGRMHPHTPVQDPAENEFRAGIHGLVVWALAVLLGAFLATAGARTLAPASAPVAQSASTGAESLLAYELDRLFRSERRPADQDISYERSEAGRILLTASSHRGVVAEDRAFLARLVSARTGLAGPDAEQRVGVILESSRDSLSRARRAGVLMGFMMAAALLLGAAVSWFAFQRGERDAYGDEISPYDSMFRQGGPSGWFKPPTRRVVVVQRDPTL